MRMLGAYVAVTAVVLASMLMFTPRTVSTTILLAATATWWVFVAWYAVRSRWHKNPYGRNTMGTGLGLALLLTVFSTSVIFKRYEGYEVVWALVFLNLAILGIEHTYYMEHTQRGINATHKR